MKKIAGIIIVIGAGLFIWHLITLTVAWLLDIPQKQVISFVIMGGLVVALAMLVIAPFLSDSEACKDSSSVDE